MRPLRLQIDGFTCFKERQELDLSRLELFAIIGPNGAGKSSLLDAITLSLYGEVPRVGDRYAELISHGRERMALTFDFGVGTRVFRVTRARRRRGAAQAQLEELVDGSEHPLADGVREVDKQIQALLGLPYEAFTQAVVLPQGEFWKFLRSQPRERREILRDLLRHQIYERMRQVAAERAGELGRSVHGLQERLEQDYAGATPAVLAELRDRADRLALDAQAADAELSRLRDVLQDTRGDHVKTCELRAGRERLRALEAREPEIREMERRVDAARRVAPVIAIVRAAEEAERTAENQVRLAEVSDAERASALGAHGAERLHLDAAELTAKELPALRDRIRQLDEVKGLVQARDSARGRLAKDRAERAGIADDLGDAERDAARARARAEAAEREVREAMARVERVGYDADVDAGLEAVRDIAVGLAALRPRAGELEAHAARVVGRAATAEAAARKRQAEAKSAGKRLGDAARALEDADRAVRDAEQTSVAALLREGLRVGAPCPVCGQAVTAASRVTALPQLEALRARRGRAGESEQQARQAATQAEAAAAAALATAQETRAAAENARAEGEAVAREISRREAELRLAIGQSLSSKSETGVEVLVQAAVQHVIELRRHHHQALAMQQQAEKRLHDARVAIEAVVHATESLRQRRDHLDDRIRESNADLSRLEGAIAMVTSAPDPLAEREDLAARHERLERDVLAARRTYQAAEARLAAATARAQAERQAAGDAARRAQRARQDAGRATRDAGFSDEVTARAAALPDAEVTRLASEADLFRRDLHAVAQRAADLFAELAGREVTDDALAAVEAESAHRERVAGEIRRELARLEIEAQSLAQRVDRAAELARQLGDRQRDHAVHRRLADDLRSERFQAFVLDESFRELAKGGSTRLMSLGGRYTFEYRDDSFYVVDHDNAGEQRSADTLSGGETFLASLALALELSEQVQSASAAVPLDSLFIDEGFGTLDPEALETVAGAIEGLPLGGRTVGIITHVPELAARLPARVIVEKRADGSRLRVEES